MEGSMKYYKIKTNLEQYSELFRLVLKIADMELQNEIVQAINEIPLCACMREKISKSTQTGEDGNFIELKYAPNTGKRRRKRSKKGPEVISTTPAKKPVIEIISDESICPPSTTISPAPSSIQPQSSSEFPEEFVDEMLSGNCSGSEIFPQNDDLDYIKKTMTKEFLTRNIRNDGYLPIETAIISKDFQLLQRQLFVHKHSKTDLNNIFTEDEFENNLLELAVRYKCPMHFFEALLDHGMIFDTTDSCGNTILHLISDYSENLELFSTFLEKLPIEHLTLQNIEGCSVLHICVKRNKYKMIQVLLDHIDLKLDLKTLKIKDSLDSSEEFYIEMYKEAFQNINERKQLHPMKEKILSLRENKSGRTALLMALGLEQLHIVYMLLNHLADPFVKDYNDSNCQTFLTNFKTKDLEDIVINVNQILNELRKSA